MDRKSNFNSADYRKALGTFATGITVVTAMSSNNEPVGLTANSFTSVSLEPPLILWCLANSSDSLAVFRAIPWFAVNILAADQRDLSEHFAKKQKNKFSSIRYRSGSSGAPLLEGCATWLQCRLIAQHVAGDHHVFIGEVEDMQTTDKEALLYHQGNYAMSLPLPEASVAVDSAEVRPHTGSEDLYTLMLNAIHTYQERFESGQHRLVANNYEARILLLLRLQEAYDLQEIGIRIQLSRNETGAILAGMEKRGLLSLTTGNEDTVIRLTEAGQEKALRLWELARQHETDALTLLGRSQADTFRASLRRLIKWGGNL